MTEASADPVDPVDVLASLLPATWRAERGHDSFWAAATPPDARALPKQGWKLHITADAENYVSTLSAAAPVLISEGVQFKVAATVTALQALNTGEAGASQIGKFITVYPVDAEQAVSVAARLDETLLGASGPRVPSDRALHADSVVSYRYGAFTGRWMQTPIGMVTPALEDPEGRLLPDERSAASAVPEWMDDPFRSAGVARELPPPPQWIADRFRVLAVLERSPRGSVYLGIDGQELQRCVLKVARRGGGPHSGAARLLREGEVLAGLAHVPSVVRCLALETTATEQILALEDLGADNLDSMGGGAFDANRAPLLDAIAAMQGFADAVAELHRHGVVHRDVKPSNAVRTLEGATRLLDLEMACTVGDPAYGIGTTGYAAPQQHARAEAQPADDVFSLGRTAARLLCAIDVTTAPSGAALAAHLRGVCPDLSEDLVALIGTATEPERDQRFPDAAAFAKSLRAASTATRAVPRYGGLSAPRDPERAMLRVRRYADALVADSVAAEEGRAWVSHNPNSPGVPVRDLANGTAGAVLALAAFAAVTGDEHHRDTVAEGARWLMHGPRFEGPPLGGMYVGDGGVLLALCRAGELLGDAEVLHHAATLAHDLAAMPVSGPDVYNGAAGRCRALVRAADTLGSTAAHGAAIALGDHLLATAISDGDGMYWVPPGEEHPGGTIGYAHGAAGIGDVLLELGERGHQRFTDAALSAARWVMRWRVDSGESVAFPATPGNGPWNPFWCHGATGVGRFAVRLHRRGLLDDPGLLRGIAHATSRLGRCSAPSMCHGLAGAIDHLIDQYQSTGDDAHLDEAWGLSSLLEGFEREGADGHLRSLTEGGPTPSFDLSIGYSGTAAAWLRLADPSRPTLVD